VQGEATQLKELVSTPVDVIILNSVVQYFPNVDYLVQVLGQALDLLSPGGALFLGDLRHLQLLETFHTAIQLHKASATLPIHELRRRIRYHLAQEKELALDPTFFLALQQTFPRISQVEVLPKRGRSTNELFTFRYDVIVRRECA